MNQSSRRKVKTQVWKDLLAQASNYPGSTRDFCKDQGLAFVRVQIQDTQLEPITRCLALPDPRWVAEVILHLQKGLR